MTLFYMEAQSKTTSISSLMLTMASSPSTSWPTGPSLATYFNIINGNDETTKLRNFCLRIPIYLYRLALTRHLALGQLRCLCIVSKMSCTRKRNSTSRGWCGAIKRLQHEGRSLPAALSTTSHLSRTISTTSEVNFI